ncbi:hypothetical protein V6N13_016810 [Hibiscus sabdariffa]
MSVLWRQIVEVQNDECVQRFMSTTHFFWILGDGRSILFWHDCWCLELPLFQIFPRLFSLAVNAMALVHEYVVEESFLHNNWRLFFRRDLRVFEEQQLGELVADVSRFSFGDRGADHLVWKPSSTGTAKIQCFLWFVLLNRLPTIRLLRGRGLPIGVEL